MKTIDLLRGQTKSSNGGIWASASLVALGAVAGAIYFNTAHGKATCKKLMDFFDRITAKPNQQVAKDKLLNVVDDVRDHVRKNAEGLLGNESRRTNASDIKPAGTPSKAWKETKETEIFPDVKPQSN